MKYEYQTNFVPVSYEKEEMGVWIFKSEALPVTPDPSSLYANKEFNQYMHEMGEHGWDLINVQPLLRGLYNASQGQNGGYGYGYSLTAGYYFFWKKEITEP